MTYFENQPYGDSEKEQPSSQAENDTQGVDSQVEAKRQEPTYHEHLYAEYSDFGSKPTKPSKPKKSYNLTAGGIAALIVICLAVSILAGAGMNYLFQGPFQSPNSTTRTLANGEYTLPPETTGASPAETSPRETAPSVGTSELVVPETAFSRVAANAIHSVVIIRAKEKVISYGQEYEATGAGSGVIYDQNGYIVTNYHVVGKDTTAISVTLSNGEVYEGRYIYGDETSDVSVIKIDKSDCIPAKFGDSGKMSLGDSVLAIGNPLGQGLSVSDGILSVLAREVTVENITMTLMQTTAAINSGNSGGGLFNLNGELIGIVNAKIGGTSVEGMGYAIPAATVTKCINDLKEHGYVTGKARLGVETKTYQYQTWPYLQTYSYVQVKTVMSGSSAETAGLQVDDILRKINGVEITSFDLLTQLLTKFKVGDTITLTVSRPKIELTSNNLSEYLSTAEEVNLTVTFIEFNPNA